MCQRHGARESKRLFLCIDIFSTSVLYCLCSDQILSELIPNTWVIPIEQMGNGNISRLNKASQSWSSTLIPDPQLMKLPTFSPTTQSQDASRAPPLSSASWRKKNNAKRSHQQSKKRKSSHSSFKGLSKSQLCKKCRQLSPQHPQSPSSSPWYFSVQPCLPSICFRS